MEKKNKEVKTSGKRRRKYVKKIKKKSGIVSQMLAPVPPSSAEHQN